MQYRISRTSEVASRCRIDGLPAGYLTQSCIRQLQLVGGGVVYRVIFDPRRNIGSWYLGLFAVPRVQSAILSTKSSCLGSSAKAGPTQRGVSFIASRSCPCRNWGPLGGYLILPPPVDIFMPLSCQIVSSLHIYRSYFRCHWPGSLACRPGGSIWEARLYLGGGGGGGGVPRAGVRGAPNINQPTLR